MKGMTTRPNMNTMNIAPVITLVMNGSNPFTKVVDATTPSEGDIANGVTSSLLEQGKKDVTVVRRGVVHKSTVAPSDDPEDQ